MIEILKKEDCCGCNACVSICPKKCISMESDNEGFKYPVVEESLCINCNLCNKVCPVINKIEKIPFNQEVYSCQNKNENIRINSSSGGVFSLLCESVINQGGVVFGAAFDNNFEVRHSYAETIKECNKFRGSKYVQSDIGNSLIQVRNFLNEGRLVLFSGTPCQVKALNLFLLRDYENLMTVDFICHGVPSPLVFSKYICELKEENKSEITKINFRDKRSGWKKFSFVVEFQDKTYANTLNDNMYMRGFLNDLYLRNSCFECKAKNFTSGSDIVLGDYWAVEKLHNEFSDDKGTSLVFVNTIKGKKVFDEISCYLKYKKTDFKYAVENNCAVSKSVKMNNNREKFFNMIFRGKGVRYSIKKCTTSPLVIRILKKIKRKIF